MAQILLVDDNPDIRELLGIVLRGSGYHVHLAATFEEALTLLDSQRFDLVVTDLFGRPGGQSFGSAMTLRDHAGPAPVGIVSGWVITAEEAGAAGFAFVVRKPFDVDELLTAIRGALGVPPTSQDIPRA